MPVTAALVGGAVGWLAGPRVKQSLGLDLTMQEAQVSCAVVGAILAYSLADKFY